MFFFPGDGTPFTLFDEYMSFGLKPIYQIWIYVLQCGYMGIFYAIYYPVVKWLGRRKAKKQIEVTEPAN